MKTRHSKWVTILGVALVLGVACAKKNDDGGGGGTAGSSKGLVSVSLTSGDVSVLQNGLHDRSFQIMTACSVYLGTIAGTHNGDCMTPLSFKARASKITVSSSMGGTPARLIDLAAAPSGVGLDGPFGVLGLEAFNFAVPATATNQYSDDNLQDTDTHVFDQVSVNAGSLDVQIEIPAGNSSVTNKFWTIRYPFIAQNPLQDAVFASCPSDSATRTKIQDEGELYASPSGFERGDILICMKASQSDTCADSDFQWIDSTNGTTSSASRPSSPVRLSGTYAMSAPTCSEGNPPSMAWGNASIRAWIADGSGFKLKKEAQWTTSAGGDQEFAGYQYTFTPTCTDGGSCSGTEVRASKITVQVDFELANSVFIHSDLNLTSDDQADILKSLNKVLPKPLYVSNNQTEEGTGLDPGIAATVSVTATP